MKKVHCLTIAVLALIAAVRAPVLGQVELIKGQDARAEARIGLYVDDADNNQDWVREFDGRTFDLFGIELLNAYGYSGGTQYWLSARDLINKNEDVDFSLGYENRFSLNLSTSSLTHRLDRVPAINPFLNVVSDGSVLFRDNLAPVSIGSTGDTFLDLSPSGEFRLDRRVNDFRLNLTPCRARRGRLIGGWWQELEGGSRQQLFRARATTDGVINDRQRGAARLPIDRSTEQGSLGADLQVGKNSVLNYKFANTVFTDNGTRPTDPVLSTVFPLNQMTRFNSETRSNVFKARTRITDRLHFTGVHINKDRENETSTIPTTPTSDPYVGAGSPLGAKVDIDSTNLALTFLATDALSLTARWRKFDQDNLVPPVFQKSDPTAPQNQALSRDLTSLDLSATYAGISRTFLKLGFERRKTDRRTNPLHPPHDDEGFEHPFTRQPTESDIWRLGVRYHPSLGFNVSGNLELWNTDNPGYVGLPTDRTKINLNATYMVRNNLALYGDFFRLDEENKDVFIGFDDIPTLATPPAGPDPVYEEERQLAAGQNFDNEIDVLTLGAWYAVNPKLTLDANLVSSNIDTSSLWIIGVSPGHFSDDEFVADTPHLLPDFVPYDAENDQWSVGATYMLNAKSRIYGRFLSSDSEGKTVLPQSPSPGYPGTLSTWTPIDVAMNRWTLGFAYQMSPKERLLLDFSIVDWEDNIDSDNDGRFSIWRLAWSTMY